MKRPEKFYMELEYYFRSWLAWWWEMATSIVWCLKDFKIRDLCPVYYTPKVISATRGGTILFHNQKQIKICIYNKKYLLWSCIAVVGKYRYNRRIKNVHIFCITWRNTSNLLLAIILLLFWIIIFNYNNSTVYT